MNELIEKVEEWARVRRLHTADPKAQALKVVEEFTEMITAFNDYTALREHLEEVGDRDDLTSLKNETIDGVGDTYVTLIILCQQLGVGFKELETSARFTSPARVVKVLNWFATGVSKGDIKTIKIGVENMAGVAKHIACHIDTKVVECLQVAYDEIKDRKGMMINGTFIKYDDLSDENKAALDNA